MFYGAGFPRDKINRLRETGAELFLRVLSMPGSQLLHWDQRLIRHNSAFNPHFSQDFYCGGGSGHVYCVALGRIPRRTVEYACGILPSRAG